MSAAHANVIRDATRQSISATEVVLGDILLVEEGDTIPADARLIQSTALHTAEAAQRVNCSLPQTAAPPADRRSLPHPRASVGNVVSLSSSHEEGTPRGVLIRGQVKEGSGSEGCSVIGQIGSESVDNILLRESGLTSVGSFSTRGLSTAQEPGVP
jgi:hypothetical protein